MVQVVEGGGDRKKNLNNCIILFIS
jgi:hypothetical protein